MAAEDVSDVMNKFSSMLNNKENIPDNIKDILDNLNQNKDSNSDSSSDLLKNISPEMISSFMSMLNNKSSDSSDDSSSGNSASNIDMGTIMKMKAVMDKMNSKDDPRSNLLTSLKPYLNNSRQSKVEQYVQLFNITKVMEVFNTSGGDKNK